MTDDPNLLKREIRKRLIYDRSHIDDNYRERYDLIILDKIVALREYREADLILIYASYNGEVDTYRLIDRALSDGKRVACPRCRIEGEAALLDFYRIDSKEDLVPGYKGIPEPRDEEEKRLAEDDMIGCPVIVPLVGYDRDNNRLGYGKGFYDRFFADCDGLMKIGIAYKCQEEERLPVDKYDIRLDMIINEKD